MNVDAHLGLSLRYARIKKGYSLRDVAVSLGKSHTFLARLERHDLSVTDETLESLNRLYETKLTRNQDILTPWMDQIDRVLQAFLNGDFLSFESYKNAMLAWQEVAERSPIYLDHAVCAWVIDVHLHSANQADMLERASLFEPLVDHIQGSLAFLARMTLFRVAFHDWRLNDAQTYLNQVRALTSHPHYKAVIDLGDAEINFHRYNRQGALRINQKAHDTFGYFNNYLRMAIAEVRGALYAQRHLTSDRLNYEPLKEKAATFHLPELGREVAMIEALRALHLKEYDFAITALKALDATDPQIYFYTAMTLHKMNDEARLKAHLKMPPKTYVMPEIFQAGLAYLKAHVKQESTRQMVTHLHHYFACATNEKLFGETRWAERELRTLYEKKRQYKAATAMLETITQTIMKP